MRARATPRRGRPTARPSSETKRHRGWRAAWLTAVLAAAACTEDRVQSPGARAPEALARSLAASAQVGSWSDVFTWPIIPAHMAVLPNLTVLTWTSSDTPGDQTSAAAYAWDPVQRTFHQHSSGAHNIFCSGQTFLPDGQLLVPGGHIADNRGMKDVRLWRSGTTAGTGSWATVASMRAGRWYPTATVLANGQAVVVAGSDENASGNAFPELWDGSAWTVLDGAPLNMPYYPWMFGAPDARVFYAGPAPEARWLNPSGGGEWIAGPTSRAGFRDYGTAVTYAPGKILIAGGGDPPTAAVELIDLNGAAPAWRYTAAMTAPRRQVNGTVLPDGRVLIVGGTRGAGFNDESNAVLTAEVWNPATEQWTALAAMRTPRLYHSTVALLADGRVLVAGGGRCGGCQFNNANAELYSPPYLFAPDGSGAVRPQLTSAPASVAFGATFDIGSPDPSRVARLTLVRLSSTTHSFNQSQGFVELAFSRSASALTATAPAGPRVVPAGHYMLFALDAAGVPSIARVVQLTGTGALPAPPGPPAAPGAVAARASDDRSIVVSWADQSGNETGFAVERCTGAGCTTFAALGTTATNVTRYQDAGLSAATTYTYRVRARNLAGGSAWSAHASATTSATPAPPPGTLVNRLAGHCLDVEGGANSAANAVLMRCVGSTSQTWTLPASGLTGEVRVFDNLCLDVWGESGNEGDVVGLWPCHGRTNQLWTRTSAGQLVGMNGRCVEPLNGGTAPGTPMRFVTCRSAASGQQWSLGVAGDQPPVAQFTVACTGLQCTFGSSGSSDDRGIQSRSWSFGDGTTMGDVVSPLKTYAAAGTYAVQLTVTDAAGQTATAARSVSVNAPAPNQAPAAAFTAACTGLTCAFTDGSSDADGAVSAWRWDFGNQATSTLRNPSVTYALSGTYTVRLTVTDDRAATASATRLVTVSAIALSATGVKTRNVYRADLRWSGASSEPVRILRNGTEIATTANDGVHADEQRRAAGTYLYRVCEAAPSTRCSADAAVTF